MLHLSKDPQQGTAKQTMAAAARPKALAQATHQPNSPLLQPQAKLPGAKEGGQPLPEGLLWLLLTGQLPTKAQADSVSAELARRAELPSYVKRVLMEMPRSTHPMTQLATGILALQVRRGCGKLVVTACAMGKASRCARQLHLCAQHSCSKRKSRPRIADAPYPLPSPLCRLCCAPQPHCESRPPVANAPLPSARLHPARSPTASLPRRMRAASTSPSTGTPSLRTGGARGGAGAGAQLRCLQRQLALAAAASTCSIGASCQALTCTYPCVASFTTFAPSLNLIAKLPAIAAFIYRKTYCGGTYIDANPNLDWGANLAHMMGKCGGTGKRGGLRCLAVARAATPGLECLLQRPRQTAHAHTPITQALRTRGAMR